MVASNHMEGSPSTPVDPSNSVPHPRSLKMKRSLSKLFSSSTRKFSRSRPPSPTEDEMMTPPTPQIPVDLWPTSGIKLDPQLLARSTDDGKTKNSQSPVKRNPQTQEKGAGWNRYNGQEGLLDRWPRREQDSSPSPGSGRLAGRASEESTRAAAEQRRKFLRDNHGPDPIPLEQKKFRTGLRLASASTSRPPIQGSTRLLSRSKSQPSLTTPARAPSLAAGLDSRPTGKRRRQDANLGGEETTVAVPSLPPVLQDSAHASTRLWPARLQDEETRSKVRSGLTAGSSPIDTTSTERSSTLTKDTSVTELTIDPQSRPASKGEGMTVDDAIDMYVKGFGDGVGSQYQHSREVSTSGGEESTRSMKIAEAMSDSMGSSVPSQRPSTSGSVGSAALACHRGMRREPHGPPPLMPPTTQRDQYGFLKANNYVNAAQYDAWYGHYQIQQERRTKKWLAFMRESSLPTYQPSKFPSRSFKTQRYVHKGIPPAWRGAAWFYYAGGNTFLQKHPELYSSLLSRSETALSDSEKESIERDLHRTFPDNIHFKPSNATSNQTSPSTSSTSETLLVRSLRRVLRAFALYAPKIGYCQSLNFIVGLLLLFLPEEKTFVMLHLITTEYLPGTHSINLEGANIDLGVLMLALKTNLPSIWAKVGPSPSSSLSTSSSSLVTSSTANTAKGKSRGVSVAPLPPISLCTTSWFMSLFIGNLPTETTLRVWDSLFYDGPRTLFRAALAVFRLGEKRIIAAASRSLSTPDNPLGTGNAAAHQAARSGGGNDSVELFQVVQGLPRGMLDAGMMMKVVARRDGVSEDWVRVKRHERRLWLAKCAAAESNVADGSRDVGGRANTANGAANVVKHDSGGKDPVLREIKQQVPNQQVPSRQALNQQEQPQQQTPNQQIPEQQASNQQGTNQQEQLQQQKQR